MVQDEHLSKGEEVRKAAEIRDKKDRGETLTREEAGFLGAVASRQSTAREAREAESQGRRAEFEEEHRTKSWMKGEDTRKPALGQETEREVKHIREKQERGETLTRHEAGVLGGTARARNAEE